MFGFTKKKSTLELLLEEDEANSQEIVSYPLATSPTFTPAISTFTPAISTFTPDTELIVEQENTTYNINAKNVYINSKKKKKKKEFNPTPPTTTTVAEYGCNFEEGWSNTYCDTYCSYCESRGAVYEEEEELGLLYSLPTIIAAPFLIIKEVFGGIEKEKRREIVQVEEIIEPTNVIEVEEIKEATNTIIELEVTTPKKSKKEVSSFTKATFEQATVEQDYEIARLRKELEIANIKKEIAYTNTISKLLEEDENNIIEEAENSYSNMIKMNPHFKRA